jgi:Mg-chelatase subunit ChlD
MHAFFKPITASEAIQQQHRLMQQSAAASTAAADVAARAAALRPGPGRPRKQLDAPAVLAAGAAAAAQAPRRPQEQEEEQASKRSKYCNWSVIINDASAINITCFQIHTCSSYRFAFSHWYLLAAFPS